MRVLTLGVVGAVLMAAGVVGKGVTRDSGGVPNPVEARARSDEGVRVPKGDPAMLAAYARGRATLDQFLAVDANRPANSRAYAVKIPVRDEGRVEWFWVSDLARDGDRFSGTIDNVPRSVRTVREGQRVGFARGDIVDWMYVQDGRVRGGFTTCALLAKESDARGRDALMRKLGMDCDA